MKNIKNSDFEDLLKLLNVFISVIIHLILIFYPIISFVEEDEESLKKSVNKEEVIEIQLMENNQQLSFAEVYSKETDSESKINDSSILSNKTVTNTGKSIKKYEDKNNNILKEKKGGVDVSQKIDAKFLNEADGNTTDISTVRFKYFDYYIDIKNKFESKWKELVASSLEGITTNDKIFKTVLVLKIDRNGTISKVEVKRTSGSRELDNIAVSSFEDRRIPIPPDELFNQKDFIYLYWGFALKI